MPCSRVERSPGYEKQRAEPHSTVTGRPWRWGGKGRAGGMWRRKNAVFCLLGLRGAFIRQVRGGEIAGFPKGLDVQGWASGML